MLGTLQLAGCARQELEPPPPGGAYLSDSGGARFEQSVNVVDENGEVTRYLSGDAIRSIHRTEQDPARVYLITGGSGVYVSSDGGHVWKSLPIPLAGVTAFVHLANGVWLASGSNENNEGIVIRSLDSGQSWQKVLTVPAAPKRESKSYEIIKPRQPPPIVITSIVINPFKPDRVFATTSTGDVLAGEDSGKEWRVLTRVEGKKNPMTGESNVAIARIIPSPHVEDEVVLVSMDGKLIRMAGGTTQQVPLPSGNLLDLVFVKQFPSAFFISTSSGYYISRDAGTNWTELGVPISKAAPLRNPLVRVSPTNPSRLFVSANSILFRSEDGGDNWNALSLELPNHTITDISIDPSSPAKVLLTATANQS